MKVIDISAKLTNEKPVVKLNENLEFSVRNDKNTVLLMQQEIIKKNTKTDIEKFDKVLEILIGKETIEKINEINMPLKDYLTVCEAVIAAATGDEMESVSERFQEKEN